MFWDKEYVTVELPQIKKAALGFKGCPVIPAYEHYYKAGLKGQITYIVFFKRALYLIGARAQPLLIIHVWQPRRQSGTREDMQKRFS
jgi:hypothetical protein